MTNRHEPSTPVRVMTVDDSLIARRLVERLLLRVGIEVVAELNDGGRVVETVLREGVEVVVLDLEMPGRSGFDVVADILEAELEVGVLIYSGASKNSLEPLVRTVESHLPCRVILKGAGAGGGIEALNDSLVPLVKELAAEIRQGRDFRVAAASTLGAMEPGAKLSSDSRGRSGEAAPAPSGVTCDLLVIGASTGGPDALREVLMELPANLSIPALVVQHMPAGFTHQLARRLNDQCAIEVREAQNGELLPSGCVLLAPGGKHLELRRDGSELRAFLTDAPPENSCRPAVDVLFRTAAELGAQAPLAIVLTGMGQDGLAGMEHIRAAGGRSIAQDEATSVVWGMPGAVIKAGLIDEILPLAEIGPRIAEYAQRGGSARRAS